MYLVTLRNGAVPTVVHGEFERIENAKITREKNAVASLEFTMLPNNPGYDLAVEFATLVDVVNLRTGELEFEGRVIACDPEQDSDGCVAKHVVCEHVAGYLNDSIQPYTEERNWAGDGNRTGLQEFIDHLLDNHNARMPEHKRIWRGLVDAPTFATADNVTKGTNFERTLDILSSKLVDVFGGEWQVRRGDDGRLYLDYRARLGSVRKTRIAIAHNIESAKQSVDPNRLITRLYPRGCKLTKTEVDADGAEREVETEERLGVAEVNAGREYIDDSELVREYGVIEGTAEWDDVTEALNLKAKAEKWLEENNKLPVANEVTALDLSAIGIDPDSFRIYDWYECLNPLVNLDATLEIVKQVVDIGDPSASTFDLGETTKTQSGAIHDLESMKGDVELIQSQSHSNVVNIENAVRYTKSAIEVAEGRIVSTVGEQIVKVETGLGGQITVVESRVSTIEQTADQIIISVSELTEAQKQMGAQIELMPDRIKQEVTEGYTAYVDGKVDVINTSISSITQRADSIEMTVKGIQASYGQCGSAASTVAKTVSIADFKLYTGATVSVYFPNGNTAERPTLNVSGTGAKPITVSNYYMGRSNSFPARAVVTFVYNGTSWMLTDCGSIYAMNDLSERTESSIKQLSDSITLTVKKGDVSSQLSVETSAITIRSNRFSWDSQYSTLSRYGELTCTRGEIGGFTIGAYSIYNDRMTLDGSGLTLKHDYNNELMGTIGVNNIVGYESTNGLIFDLEPLGEYMSWAHRRSASASTYTMVLTYYASAHGDHSKDSLAISTSKLDVYCDVDFHDWEAKNFWFDPNDGGAKGGKTLVSGGSSLGTVRLTSPTGTYWDVRVKNGVII